MTAGRARLADKLNRAAALACLPVGGLVGARCWASGSYALALAVAGICGAVLVVACVPQISSRARALWTLGAAYATGVFGLVTMGLSGGGLTALAGFVVLAGVLVGARAILPALAVALATLASCGALHAAGWLEVRFEELVVADRLVNWLRVGSTWAAVTLAVSGSVVFLLKELAATLDHQQRLVDELRAEVEERKRAAEALESTRSQLSQARKLEAVGRLASGVAHDFNNTLTVILTGAELIESQAADAPKLRRAARRLIDASQQGAALTQQLLSLSRGPMDHPEVLPVARLVARATDLLQRVLPSDIRVEPPEEDLGLYARVDATQLQQAVINLGLNARDAMPEGGTLTVRVERAQLEVGNAVNLVPGSYVRVSVQDSGTGIVPEVAEHIFEPFFTTKPEGAGTGLGLANVQELATRCKGGVEVLSNLGQGSTFSLYLPEAEPRASGVDSIRPSHCGGATVLVVDDEPQVRASLAATLRDEGHRVLEAPSGRTALEALEAHGDEVELVFADLVLPDVSGADLIRRLRERRLELPIVVCSGYTGDPELQEQINNGFLQVVQKPFTRAQLSRAMAEALRTRRPPATGRASRPRVG